MKTTTVGLDLAKNVFQVHAIDEAGEVIVRRALRRRQVLPFFERLAPSLVGMEACGTSHYWARELSALGHTVDIAPTLSLLVGAKLPTGAFGAPLTEVIR